MGRQHLHACSRQRSEAIWPDCLHRLEQGLDRLDVFARRPVGDPQELADMDRNHGVLAFGVPSQSGQAVEVRSNEEHVLLVAEQVHLLQHLVHRLVVGDLLLPQVAMAREFHKLLAGLREGQLPLAPARLLDRRAGGKAQLPDADAVLDLLVRVDDGEERLHILHHEKARPS